MPEEDSFDLRGAVSAARFPPADASCNFDCMGIVTFPNLNPVSGRDPLELLPP